MEIDNVMLGVCIILSLTSVIVFRAISTGRHFYKFLQLNINIKY